ncbi:hypothetical protein FTUN_2481 [Frigoriglobus tundricola]|uniref:Uncharacterized protein n=1 Tax=Frigoriglobus tundricola TaxID=2774151 RepID=A0A6M5YM04_9BACT|nr:hypothetical protein FTUN_2481 [Frigoriglobus tundricola]
MRGNGSPARSRAPSRVTGPRRHSVATVSGGSAQRVAAPEPRQEPRTGPRHHAINERSQRVGVVPRGVERARGHARRSAALGVGIVVPEPVDNETPGLLRRTHDPSSSAVRRSMVR